MSDIRIKTCVLGQVSTNCYLVYDEQTKEGVVIDPADNAPYIPVSYTHLTLPTIA